MDRSRRKAAGRLSIIGERARKMQGRSASEMEPFPDEEKDVLAKRATRRFCYIILEFRNFIH